MDVSNSAALGDVCPTEGSRRGFMIRADRGGENAHDASLASEWKLRLVASVQVIQQGDRGLLKTPFATAGNTVKRLLP
jgi:hypothetical protein